MEKKHKILIVEDEQKLLNLLKNKIEQTGWEAILAADGQEALDKIATQKIDLVLLDLLLPKLNGFEVLSKLREKTSQADLPVIVLTNHGNNDNVSRVLDLGADIFLVKSNYSLDEIVEKIKGVLKIS